jgi:hypothetical protein
MEGVELTMDGGGTVTAVDVNDGSCSGCSYTAPETLGSCHNKEMKTGRCRRLSSLKGGNLVVAQHG